MVLTGQGLSEFRDKSQVQHLIDPPQEVRRRHERGQRNGDDPFLVVRLSSPLPTRSSRAQGNISYELPCNLNRCYRHFFNSSS